MGKSTIYDIKGARQKILEFYSQAEFSSNAMKTRKTTRDPKFSLLNKSLYEWFKQRRSQGFPISGHILSEKAKEFHLELNIAEPCEFSSGWIRNFKTRYGIRHIRLHGEKTSADTEAAEEYVETFSKFAKDENLKPSQIYNADETGVFWRCMPRITLSGMDEGSVSGCKEAKERVTALTCANASGTHKCKLLVIGKSKNPRCFKGVKTLPVIYRANSRAWITRDLMMEWFHDHFVPEVRESCNKEGLPKDCKIVLLLDNCSAHPPAHLLVSGNISAMYLPPNCTSLIQPMDQGIIRSMKCYYRRNFMQKLLQTNNLDAFKKQFTMKDCVWTLAKAWNAVVEST